MRLVDADDIWYDQLLNTGNKEHPLEWAVSRSRIDNMPTIEVVRCKDCIHKPTGSGVNHDIEFPEQDYRCPCRCEDYWYSWMPDDDWFCANGERRKDETD